MYINIYIKRFICIFIYIHISVYIFIQREIYEHIYQPATPTRMRYDSFSGVRLIPCEMMSDAMLITATPCLSCHVMLWMAVQSTKIFEQVQM